jgi:DNA-binding transcriptional regulator YbjK
MYCKYMCTVNGMSGKPPRRRSATEISEAIVSAAVRVVGRCGVDGLTHRAVAEEAGVSLSSTTYHFSSREDIVGAALRWVAQQETAKARTGLDDLIYRDGDAQLQDHTLMEAIVEELIPKDPATLRAQYELQLYATDHPQLQAVVRTWIDAIEEMFIELLHRLGAKQPAQSARLLVAVIDGLRLTALTTPRSDEQIAKDRAAVSWLRDCLMPTEPHRSKARRRTRS